MKPFNPRLALFLAALLLSPTLWAQTQRFTLGNGMTVIVKPDRRAPTAVHMLWVRVGSMDEVDGASGVAHVLEHMMFKGTPTMAPGEYSRRVAALGGTHNAFTSRDATAYHQQVPSDQVLAVMALEADRFANNQWSDDEFRREIEVIKEERRQRVEESPRARMYEAYNAQVFLASPYRRPIIGWMSDIESLTPDDARAFHRRWYVPANAAVVVAGDVDPQQVLAWAEQTYGRIPARAVPERKPRAEPPQHGPRRLEYRARAEQAVLTLGWKTPQLRDPAATDAETQDALALTLLASVLDGYNGARLGRTLVQGEGGQRLADSVDASYGLLGRGPQLFTLTGVPAPGVSPDALAEALKAQVRRVADSGVTEAELQRVKTQWRAGEVYKLDSVVNQARELGSYWVQGWDIDAGERLLQRLMAVTPAQVQSVAQRLFDERQLSVGLLVPEAKP
jgi:zinc protease